MNPEVPLVRWQRHTTQTDSNRTWLNFPDLHVRLLSRRSWYLPALYAVRVGHREQLLAAARRLLEDKGYAHITARDLVAASNTNLASIGYHFGSKAGLLNAAISEAFGEWCEQLAEVAMRTAVATPMERAHVAWSAMLDGLDAKRSLLLSFMDAFAQADRTPELREQFAEHYERIRDRVAELGAESLGGGVDGDDPRIRAMASFVIAVCDGLSMQWLLDPKNTPTGAELMDGLVLLWETTMRTMRHAPEDSP